jgi:hypothetical protein
MIDRRARYLDRAFPKSQDQLLNEEIERELGRYPDGGKAFIAEFLAEHQTEVSNETATED